MSKTQITSGKLVASTAVAFVLMVVCAPFLERHFSRFDDRDSLLPIHTVGVWLVLAMGAWLVFTIVVASTSRLSENLAFHFLAALGYGFGLTFLWSIALLVQSAFLG